MIELRRRYSGSKGSDSPSFSRLPDGYQEVEWLMNTGGAYIETGVVPPDGCCFEVEAALKTAPLLQEPAYDYCVFGCGISYNNIGFAFYFNNVFASPSLGIVFHMGESSIIKGGTGVFPTSDIFYKYKYENGTCIINDEVVLSDNPFIEFGHAIDIFAARIGNSHIGRQDGLKLKPLKLYTDTTDVAEFIPCYRISDRVAGMYDIVNDVFYTNAGAGEFLYGPDVHYNIPPEYQQVEYLESNGTQYIITDIYPILLDRFEIDIVVTQEKQDNISYGISACANYAETNKRFGIFLHDNLLMIIGNNTYYISNIPIVNGTKHTISYEWSEESYNVILDDDLYKAARVPLLYEDVSIPLGIFNCVLIDGVENAVSARVYTYKYYRRGKLIANFIPCYRKEDDVAGMYDLVSDEFYTNAGTGTFEVGPDVIG